MTTAITTEKKRSAGIELSIESVRKALAAVSDAVPSRSPRPILQNVLISHETITGCNLDLRIVAALPGATFKAVVPFQRLKAIVGTAWEKTIAFRVEGNVCKIATSGGQWSLPTEDASEYPEAGARKARPIARLPADQFVMLAKTVLPAAAKNDPRYAGVQIEFAEGRLGIIATDGHRLAVAECDVDQATDDAAALVPATAIDTLVRLAAGCEEVQLETTGRELVATAGTVTLSAQLLESQFPKWRLVEPAHSTEPTVTTAGELLAACRRASICVSETSRGVRWNTTPTAIEMSAKSAEYGESKTSCSLCQPGHACSFTVNAAYASEWLATLDPAESVELFAKDAASGILLKADDGDRRITIMPLET